MKIQFVVVISTKVKVASTPKHLKELVVRSYFKKPKETCRSATNAIIGYKEGIRAQNSPPPSVSTTFNLMLNCISLEVTEKVSVSNLSLTRKVHACEPCASIYTS